MIQISNKPGHLRKIIAIVGSFAVAMMLSVVVLPPAWSMFRPDFVALVLIFWCYRQPKLGHLTTAFVVGLLTDVMYFGVIGQHALAKVVIAYLAIQIAVVQIRNLRSVSILTLLVFGLLLLNTGIISAVNVYSLGYGGLNSVWIQPFAGTALWFLFAYGWCLKEQTNYDAY